MAELTITGLEEYIEKLKRLEKNSEGIAKQALYEGAGIVADEIRKEVENLPIDEKWGTPEHQATGIRKKQKKGLLGNIGDGMGISEMRKDNGVINVRIGFRGYNEIKTKLYPKGQPNRMIARAVESGTSFSKKIPFSRKAVKWAEVPAREKIREVFEKGIEDSMKG